MWRHENYVKPWDPNYDFYYDPPRRIIKKGENMKTKIKVKTLADAAEALWGVVANVDNGDWTKQDSQEWIMAARKARDDYHEAVKLLSPSETAFSILGWLSTRKGTLKIGGKHNCGKLADLIGKFCEINNLAEPRESWHKICVRHPKE